MKDVTKLSCWAELEVLGFKKIRFTAFGRVQAIGASNGIITIEPHNFQLSKDCYHISGHSNKPITRKCYRYDSIGRKEEIYTTETFYSEFVTARDILKVVKNISN